MSNTPKFATPKIAFGSGQALSPVENDPLVRGAGQYSEDIKKDGQLFMYILRSPIASGRITSLDISGAKQAPGVHYIMTYHDLQAQNIGDIPCIINIKNIDESPHHIINHPILAKGVVRHVGEPIVAIIADSYYLAQSASELIFLEFDESPAVVDMRQAIARGAPQIWPECPKNINFHWSRGDRDGTAQAFANADKQFSFEIINNRLAANPMENRNCLCFYDENNCLTLHVPSQGVHIMQRLIGPLLGLSAKEFRVITQQVGGGFGMKIFPYPEYVLALMACRALKKPVRWVANRTDAHLSDAHARDHITQVAVALDKNNNITAMRADTLANMGAYLSVFGPYIPTDCGSLMLGLLYNIPHLYAEVKGIFTNTNVVDAYRGAGRPEAAYATDRAMELTARAIGEDAIAFKKRHLITPGQLPMTNAMRNYYDSGNYPETFQLGLDYADYKNFATRRAISEKKGLLRGLGCSFYSESCGAGQGESAKIIAKPDGKFQLIVGSQNNGQGQETTLKQIMGYVLGVDMDKIEFIEGDTNLVATGNGTGGSRMSSEAGSATKLASEDILTQAKNLAGQEWGITPDDIGYADGLFHAGKTNKTMDWGDIAQLAQQQGLVLQGDGQFKGISKTFPNGVHVIEVEIDPELGQIFIDKYTVHDDFGHIINPITLSAQVHGGIGQGLGQAMMEQVQYNEQGQLLTASLMDYALPRASDIPHIDFHYTTKYPTKNNILGVKGAGEAGAIGAPPALINAVENAIIDNGLGYYLRGQLQMPLTPEKLWRSMSKDII